MLTNKYLRMKKAFYVFILLSVILLFLYNCRKDTKSNSYQKIESKTIAEDSIQKDCNKTGDWQIVNCLDDFNEKTGKEYILLGPIKGLWRSLASNDYDLDVIIEADTDHIEIKLFEYGTKSQTELAKNVTFKVKESNGDIHYVRTYAGSTFPRVSNINDSLFRAILSRGGKIEFSATHSLYGDKKIYKFTIPNADNFKDAMNEIISK